MRVLLLSAYDALSHRYWRQQLEAQFPNISWTVLALAPRHFSYRVRANPLVWYSQHRATLAQRFDLVIATSMADVATLRGLVPLLAATPVWLYCHENQFDYPDSKAQQSELQRGNRLQAQLVFLYNCLCASAISFNSNYNKKTALAGLRKLLDKFPDKFDAALIKEIELRSDVLPVPLASFDVRQRHAPGESMGTATSSGKRQPGLLQLLWNHRWEYDKGPEHLLAFASLLSQSGVPATLHIVGQQFRDKPRAFDELEKLLDAGQASSPAALMQAGLASNRPCKLQRGRWGFVENMADYRKLLMQCDVVISTALHDFQGLAILEACAAGCLPLLPNRLVYPEQFDAKWLYSWHDDPARNALAMCERLFDIERQWRDGCEPPQLQQFTWRTLHARYAAKLEAVSGCSL
ncbi:MAG: DUF3524 domain-containing protein [Pseudomonadales bacterium]|nr:DUF3524 domain-containing protein [Pseudomonadales bacterium]RZV53302.1 MAG: DUF3524 domain-containing protein [Pseudomonadales bacterium]